MRAEIAAVLRWIAAAAVLPPVLSWAQADFLVQGRITVDGTDVVAEFKAPAGCWPLAFQLPAATGYDRSRWAEKCTILENDTLRALDGCAKARLRIPSANQFAERVYPVATEVEGRGIWVNGAGLQASSACGPVDWVVQAPPGSQLVIEGRPAGRTYRGADEHAVGYLAPAVFFTPLGQPLERVVTGANMGASWKQDIKQAAEILRSIFGHGAPEPFVVVSALRGRGTPRYQASVADRNMLQVNLFDFPPESNAKLAHAMRGTLAHEWTHLFVRPPAGLHSPQPVPVSEGQAEAGRILASLDAGWMDARAADEELARMANECVLALGAGAVTRDSPVDRGRIPYDCGGVVYTLAVLSSPERRTAWPQALREDCAGTTCIAREVTSTLSIGTSPAAEIAKAFQAARIGVVPRPLRVEELTRARGQWFADIMRADCRKSVGFETRPDALKVSRIASCANLREGMEVIGANGVDLFKTPAALLASATRACSDRGTIALTLKDGGEIAAACGTYEPPAALFEAGDAVR